MNICMGISGEQAKGHGTGDYVQYHCDVHFRLISKINRTVEE